VATLEELEADDADALFRLVRASSSRLTRALKAEGLNVGVNQGAVAGAGVAAHLHVHVVPRWSGDTNFMPVLADARVVPQALDATRDHLAKFFADLEA
jgi:ATP adenylyltransferase